GPPSPRAREIATARRRQEPGERGRRHRRAEQITLHFRAAERAQRLRLLVRLDAFRGGGDLPRRGDVDDRLDDVARIIAVADTTDERAVDLDLVERKPLQIAQRGIARAEIV